MPEKKIRVDKRKNIEKIAKVRLSKPRATTREVAEETGLDHSTVAKLDKQIPQIATKDDRIITLTETDFDIVVLAQQRIQEKLEDDEAMSKTSIEKISSVAKDSAARYSVFRGNITDAKGGLNLADYEKMTAKEIQEHIKSLLLG